MKKEDLNSHQHKDNSQDDIMNRVNQAFDQMIEDAKGLVHENNDKNNR